MIMLYYNELINLYGIKKNVYDKNTKQQILEIGSDS